MTRVKKAGAMVQVVEHQTSKSEALSLISSTTKKNKKQEKSPAVYDSDSIKINLYLDQILCLVLQFTMIYSPLNIIWHHELVFLNNASFNSLLFKVDLLKIIS
jgi:hypothetical protein